MEKLNLRAPKVYDYTIESVHIEVIEKQEGESCKMEYITREYQIYHKSTEGEKIVLETKLKEAR